MEEEITIRNMCAEKKSREREEGRETGRRTERRERKEKERGGGRGKGGREANDKGYLYALYMILFFSP